MASSRRPARSRVRVASSAASAASSRRPASRRAYATSSRARAAPASSPATVSSATRSTSAATAGCATFVVRPASTVSGNFSTTGSALIRASIRSLWCRLPLRTSKRAAHSRACPANSSRTSATVLSQRRVPSSERRETVRSPRPAAPNRPSTNAAEAANSIAAYGDDGRSSQLRCRSTSSNPRARLPVSPQKSRCWARLSRWCRSSRIRRYPSRCASTASSKRPVRR